MKSIARKRVLSEAGQDAWASGKHGPTMDFRQLLKHAPKFFLLGSLVLVFIVMTVLNSRFLSVDNIINISRHMAINLIIAVGMTFCLISGGMDLAVGSIGIMAGCLTGVILHKTDSIFFAIAGGLAAGSLFGSLNGLVISKLRVNPFVTTLGTMIIARGIALIMTGGDIIGDFPDAFNIIGVGFVMGIPIPVIIMIAVAIWGHIVLSKTEFGLNTYAIGSNPKAARLAGLKNDLVLFKIYTISGFLAAMAGIVLTARVVSAQPNLMMTTNLDVIAAVVVGGTSLMGGSGSIVGTILGSTMMAALFNGLNLVGVGYEWQLIVVGLILITAVSLDMLSRKQDI
jgi:ribose transport system permease protein